MLAFSSRKLANLRGVYGTFFGIWFFAGQFSPYTSSLRSEYSAFLSVPMLIFGAVTQLRCILVVDSIFICIMVIVVHAVQIVFLAHRW